MSLKANNLYGPSVMQLLPTEIFDWVIAKYFNLDNFSHDDSIGFFLELHLVYLDEMHDLHNDYPLPLEKVKITKESINFTKFIKSWNSKKNYS